MSRCVCGKESCNEDCSAYDRFAYEQEQSQQTDDDPPDPQPQPGEPITDPADEPAIEEPAPA